MDNTNETGSNASGTKSCTVAAVLNLLLGGFGAHNFYLAKTKVAVVELIVGILLFVMAYLLSMTGLTAVLAIYTIIVTAEGIAIVTGQNTNAEPASKGVKVVFCILFVVKIVLSAVSIFSSLG